MEILKINDCEILGSHFEHGNRLKIAYKFVFSQYRLRSVNLQICKCSLSLTKNMNHRGK